MCCAFLVFLKQRYWCCRKSAFTEKMSLTRKPKYGKSTVSASFVVIMLLHKGLTHDDVCGEDFFLQVMAWGKSAVQ